MSSPSIRADRPAEVVAPQPGHAGRRWLAGRRDALRAEVTTHGALLIRGLQVRDAETFAAAAAAVTDRLMIEREPFAPRTPYPNGVYSATAWPPDQPMCAHHELSYATRVPALQLFGCLAEPDSGGAITLADGAAVLRALPDDLVAAFDRYGWRLTRNHNDVVGVPWPEAYGVDSPDGVRRYCRDHDIECTWDAGGGLRTRRRRPAIRTHPVTGERVWFNQVAFLSEWTMEPAVREYLTLEFGPGGLPFDTALGDGTPLDPATIEEINDVYAAHTVRVPLRAGDLLLVDNLRTAHGRDPYRGAREIVVGLADPRDLVPTPTRP